MPPPADALVERGRRLERLTFGWNTLELVVAVATGLAAHSLALVAFGLDSGFEVLGSIVVLWHLAAPGDRDRERRSMRMIAGGFCVLGVYLTGVAAQKLLTGGDTAATPFGAAFMGTTVVMMLLLARAKHRTARRLHSSPLHANAHLTGMDGVLALTVLISLLLRIQFGWQLVDPLAAAAVALIAFNEARAGWVGDRAA